MDAQINQFFTECYEGNWYLSSRAEVLAAAINHICSDEPLCRVVDIGAGTGAILSRVKVGAAPVGIEGDWGLARIGRTTYNMTFVVADLSRGVPLSNRSVDVVLALDVLEHLENDRSMMDDLFRVLRPSGRLVISVPAFQSLWSRHDELHHHKRRYSKRQLLNMITSTGFGCTRVTYFNSLLFPFVYACRKLEPFTRPSASDYEKLATWAGALGAVFRLESRIIPYWNLPIGVSLLAVATKP
jgi:SAM-dependent methyltransferase